MSLVVSNNSLALLTGNTSNSSVSTLQHVSSIKELTVWDYIELVLLLCLVICIISGNVLVILSFAIVGRKIETITNYFVVSLAVADILVGTFSVPFWMVVKFKGTKVASVSYLVFVAFDIMCGVASILNLTMISVERVFAVVRPATHRNLARQKHLIFSALIFVWAFAAMNAGLCFLKVYFGWRNYTIYIFCVGFVLPALVIIGSYVIIYKVAQNHVSEERRIQQEMRLAIMIAMVVTLFLVCWFPFFMINILHNYCKYPHCNTLVMKKFVPFVKFLHYSNSMMNPIVYAYRNADYREAFKRLIYGLFGRVLPHRNNSGRSSITMRSDIDDGGQLSDSVRCSLRSVRNDSFLTNHENGSLTRGVLDE